MKCREDHWECARYHVSGAIDKLIYALGQCAELPDLRGLEEIVSCLMRLRPLIGAQPTTYPWDDLPEEAAPTEPIGANTEVPVEEEVDS